MSDLTDYLTSGGDPGLGPVGNAEPVQGVPAVAPPWAPVLNVTGPTISAPPVAPTGRVSYPQPASGLAGAISQPTLATIPGAGQKPGWRPTTQEKTTSQAMQYSPETVSAIGENLANRKDVALRQFEYENAQGGVQRQLQGQLQAFDEAAEARRRLAEQHVTNATREYNAKLSTMMKDAANDREDPMKWFHDQGTFGNIVTAALMAVQGFGYGYSGRGVNPAETLNSMIRSSVESQRQAHQTKREGIEDTRSQFAKLKEDFGDETRAMLASEIAQREFLVSDLQRQANDATNPAGNRLRASQLAQSLSQIQEDALTKLDHDTATKIETKANQAYREPQAAGQAPIGIEVTLGNGQKRVVSVATAKELGMLPGEQAGLRKTLAEAAKAEGATAKGDSVEEARKQMKSDLDELEELNKDAGYTGLWTPENRRRANALQKKIAVHYNLATSGIKRVGAEAEQERLEKAIIPNLLTADTPEARQAQIDELRASLAGPAPSATEAAPGDQ